LDIVSEQLPDGSMILLDPINSTAYPLSESAAVVWNACDGDHETTTIVQELDDRYDAPRQRIEQDVDDLLRHLGDLGLLE
jgi:Coenzyme PQQ synthesis protein D (PqqD)